MPLQRAVHDSGISGQTANTAMNVGDAIYLLSTGRWALAIASAIGTAAQGICGRTVTAADIASSDPSRRKITVHPGGVFDGFTGLTVGGRVWLSPTVAGAYTQTLPSTTGHVVQDMGFALNATTIVLRVSAPILIRDVSPNANVRVG